MKNEDKVKEILECEKCHLHKEHTICDNCFDKGLLLKMAEWKDERVKSCFVLISKLIKDGVFTKDNIEHIMVEQMIELYNNLKI